MEKYNVKNQLQHLFLSVLNDESIPGDEAKVTQNALDITRRFLDIIWKIYDDYIMKRKDLQ